MDQLRNQMNVKRIPFGFLESLRLSCNFRALMQNYNNFQEIQLIAPVFSSEINTLIWLVSSFFHHLCLMLCLLCSVGLEFVHALFFLHKFSKIIQKVANSNSRANFLYDCRSLMSSISRFSKQLLFVG